MALFNSAKSTTQAGNSDKLPDKDDLQLVLGLSSSIGCVHSEVTHSTEWEVNKHEKYMHTGSSLGYQQSGGPKHSYHSLREVNFSLISSGHSFLSQSCYESGSKSLAIFSNQGLSFSSDDDGSSRTRVSHARLEGNAFSDDSESMLCNDVIGNTLRGSGVTHDEGSTSAAKRVKLNNRSILHNQNMLNNQRILDVHDADVLAFQGNGKYLLDHTEEVLTKGNDSSSSKSCSFSLVCEPSSASGGAGLTYSNARSKKMCKFPGCTKGARGSSGLCITHGGGRRCQKPNCTKGAESGTNFCKTHGGGPRCQSLGCLKSAEGKTDFCIAHGGGRRCNVEGCTKASRGKSGKCIRHGGGKRCQREGCNRSAEGISGLCISHGGGRRCQFPECGKGAQGSTMFCKAHGGGKRCVYEGCTKGAEGSTFLCKAHGGGKRCTFGGGICTKSVHGGTLFCVAHGGGKRCSFPGCTKSARGRTDCCVRHGGGKRCKFEKCDKSAQGNTDFCKAHGGGKRSFCRRDSSIHNDKSTDGKSSVHKAIDEKIITDNFPRRETGRHDGSQKTFMEQYVTNSDCMNPSCSISMSASSSIHGFSEKFSKSVSSRNREAAETELMRCESDRAQISLGRKGEIEYHNNKTTSGIALKDLLLNRESDGDVVNACYIPKGKMVIVPTDQKTTHLKYSKDKILSPGANESFIEKLQSSHNTLDLASNDPLAFSLPSLEQRVHGGGIMALLAKESTIQGPSLLEFKSWPES